MLLLFAGQTVIFLLRLVAADRRDGRRRPLASSTPTVGELEDAEGADDAAEDAEVAGAAVRAPSAPERRPRRATGRRAPRRARIASPAQGSRRLVGPVPVLATYFSVRRGRDPFFKFFMKTIFPRQVKEYEEKFGIRFVGWYNVAHGWDFDNVIMLDLPDYATLDKLEADEATRALGHRAGEWIFERHHSMFLRERLGPDLEYHG